MAGKKTLKDKGSKATSKSKKIKATPKKESSSTICNKHYFVEDDFQKIQENLLNWYDNEQRTLPWRDIAKTELDPNIRGYSVWVSEVMLQQTQVATVIPYFNKWIEKWPTVKCLANANIEEVLQVWAGLGYYSRGRRLHEGAQIIVNKLDGQVPDTVQELMDLIPGIGAYSASAIASVAFQKAVGVVDGNVIRVLSRMRVIGTHVSQPGVRDHLWELVNKLVSMKRPGDFNQALMELGAVVCTPQNPNCAQCPVNSYCGAYSMTKSIPKVGMMDSFVRKDSVVKKVDTLNRKIINSENNDIPDIENIVDCNFCLPISTWNENPQVTVFPVKVEKKSARQEKVSVLVIEQEDKFLMIRRPEKGLLAGLWEFPSSVLSEKAVSAIGSLVKEVGISGSVLSSKKLVGEVVHLFSHIHTTYVVEHLILSKSLKTKSSKKETMWITQEEIKTAAVSTAMKKVLALVKKSNVKPMKQVTNKKRKLSEGDSKQTSIKSYFS